jgi:hypothetical protein
MLWSDSSNNIFKIRNSSNNGWVTLFKLNDSNGLHAEGGLTATGNITLADSGSTSSQRIVLGTGGDFHLFHNGSNSFITNSVGNIAIEAKAGEMSIKCVPDGEVELYHNDGKRLHTHSTGCTITGYLHFQDGSSGTDSGIGLGNSDDLQIYHDGSNSYVAESGTGALILGGGSVGIMNAAGSENNIWCTENGAVSLYYDNTKMFETTSVGCRIGGSTTANTAGDDLVIEGTSDRGLSIIAATSSSSNIYLGDTDDADIGRIAYQHTDNKIEITVNSHTGFTLDSAARIFNTVAAAGQTTNCYEINKNGGGVATDTAQNMILFQVGGNNRSGCESGSGGSDLGAFYSTSDRRIKTNFRMYTGGWDKIKKIPVKMYDELLNDDTKELIGDKPKTDCLGWIADEFQEVFPDYVRGEKDAVDENGKPIFQTITQQRIFPDVVQALQSAITKIETLETKVAALEAA